MHLTKDCSMPVMSLLELSSVRVLAPIITAQGEVDEATIDGLEIPNTLKFRLKDLASFMFDERLSWFAREQTHSDYEPIFAADGTLDFKRSSELILQDEALDISTRFSVAATFCHESFIFEHGPNFTEDQQPFEPTLHQERSNIRGMVTEHGGAMLRELWFEIVQAHGDAEVLQQLYADGISHAVYEKNDIALRYFVGKASASTVADTLSLLDDVFGRYFIQSAYHFTPTTHCMIFAKLDEKWDGAYRSWFCYFILRCFTFRGFRWLFGESVSFIVDEVNPIMYRNVLYPPFYDAVDHKNPFSECLVSAILSLAAKRPELLASAVFEILELLSRMAKISEAEIPQQDAPQ